MALYGNYIPDIAVNFRMQAQRSYNGMSDVFRKTLKHEGFRGFYKGIFPNLLKVVPSASITYMVYESMKKSLDLEWRTLLLLLHLMISLIDMADLCKCWEWLCNEDIVDKNKVHNWLLGQLSKFIHIITLLCSKFLGGRNWFVLNGASWK